MILFKSSYVLPRTIARFAILDAPSILGLRPTEVEYLPEAIKAAGLLERLNAEYAGQVSAPEYNSKRDEETLLLNPEAIRNYSKQLANAVARVLESKRFPRFRNLMCCDSLLPIFQKFSED